MALDGVDGAGPEPSASPRGPVILGRRRSVVATALSFALGAGLAYGLLKAVERLQGVVIMLALAMLIALTLDPLVTLLQRRGIPRWAAALLAWLLAVAVLMAPIVLAVDAASQQLPNLIKSVPSLITQAEDNLGGVGRRLRTLTASGSSSSASVSPDKILTYLFEGGQALFKAAEGIVVVGALSLFLVMTMPRLIKGGLALVPLSRRNSVETVTNDLLQQVSRFMLANVLTSVLAGVATWAWAFGWGVPYPILLGALVAVLDLIPIVGSTVGGVVVSLVALTVGLPTAVATGIFYVAFRLAEDYLIQPRAMRYSVELPGVVTVPAVLAGGAILGIPGALFAVPIALIIRVLIREVAMPALDRR
jgi:predicted PurR-regulated permease PerM